MNSVSCCFHPLLPFTFLLLFKCYIPFPGPTLLFERYFSSKSSRRYFACSASRDRKGCQFFQWEDEKITTGKEVMQMKFLEKLKKERDVVEDFKKLREDALASKQNLSFCIQCSKIFIGIDKQHDGHQTRKLSKHDFVEPSKFLLPAENKKTNAVSIKFIFLDVLSHAMQVAHFMKSNLQLLAI